MRGVRGAAARLRGRHQQNKGRPWNRWKAERIRCGAHEDVRGDSSARFLLVIDDGTRTLRRHRLVAVMAGQMRMNRLTVMVLGLAGIEMHVQKGRADRAYLHEHDESGRGQPAKHPAIVVKDEREGT